jgi:hypothetical protein
MGGVEKEGRRRRRTAVDSDSGMEKVRGVRGRERGGEKGTKNTRFQNGYRAANLHHHHQLPPFILFIPLLLHRQSKSETKSTALEWMKRFANRTNSLDLPLPFLFLSSSFPLPFLFLSSFCLDKNEARNQETQKTARIKWMSFDV